MGFLDEFLGPAGPSAGATTPETTQSLKEVYFFFKILRSVLQEQLPSKVKTSKNVKRILTMISNREKKFQKELTNLGFVNVDKAYKEQAPVAKNFEKMYKRLKNQNQKYVDDLSSAYNLYHRNGALRGSTIEELLSRDGYARTIRYWSTLLQDWNLFQGSYFPARHNTTNTELRMILNEIWNLIAQGCNETDQQLWWLRERALNLETE